MVTYDVDVPKATSCSRSRVSTAARAAESEHSRESLNPVRGDWPEPVRMPRAHLRRGNTI